MVAIEELLLQSRYTSLHAFENLTSFTVVFFFSRLPRITRRGDGQRRCRFLHIVRGQSAVDLDEPWGEIILLLEWVTRNVFLVASSSDVVWLSALFLAAQYRFSITRLVSRQISLTLVIGPVRCSLRKEKNRGAFWTAGKRVSNRDGNDDFLT